MFPTVASTIFLNSAGTFSVSYAGNSQNDDVAVTIGTSFSGVVDITSAPGDGEVETVTFILPPGWSVTPPATVPYGSDDPGTGIPVPVTIYTYQVINDLGFQVGNIRVIANSLQIVCFGGDVLIDTASGLVAAGELKVGDLVQTADAGLQRIRWIGKRALTPWQLLANPRLRPIRIEAGALGGGLPHRDVLVSPQHRVLVRGKVALKMFGSLEVLVAAKQLVEFDGISVAQDVEEITYVHFVFDDHQIVFAEGAAMESMYTGKQALRALNQEQREEVLSLFPHLADNDQDGETRAVRPLVRGSRARKMVARLCQNEKRALEAV